MEAKKNVDQNNIIVQVKEKKKPIHKKKPVTSDIIVAIKQKKTKKTECSPIESIGQNQEKK